MLAKQQCHELYQKHAPAASRRAQRLLGDMADADDVVHDVFLALFERYEQYRAESSISTYLYAAVTHACLNRLRNRRTRHGLLEANPNVASAAFSNAETSVLARDLLERLPEPLAELAVYHYLDELSQREIAGVLGCSHTHVAHLLERLNHFLKRQERA